MAVTKEAGLFRIEGDTSDSSLEARRTESGVTISVAGSRSVELTKDEWKALVNSMGYHGGPANQKESN